MPYRQGNSGYGSSVPVEFCRPLKTTELPFFLLLLFLPHSPLILASTGEGGCLHLDVLCCLILEKAIHHDLHSACACRCAGKLAVLPLCWLAMDDVHHGRRSVAWA